MALRRFLLAVAGAAAFFVQPCLAQTAPVYQDSGGRNTGAMGVFAIGRSSIATGQTAVSTSATLVAAARPGRLRITLSPTTSVVYYVGAAGVTSGTGVYVAAGASITLDTSAAVYATGASAVVISYVEVF